jgi:8-oxo-dGTP pyrophosphatase MutT (NUDIX family)
VESIAKVVIYVIQRGHLLVLDHPEAPQAGLQVPAGTVRPGEDLADAAGRELREETGIEDAVFRLLGTATYDMTPYGREEIHDRSFFLAELQEEQPIDRRWRRSETHDGVGVPDVFELYWLSLDTPNLSTHLEAGQGALLGEVTS